MTRHIILIGFMGAGKTAVAAALQTRGYAVVDLDCAIETHSGKLIREIFRDAGEDHFRALETAQLRALTPVQPTVVATGGGIVKRAENWDAMRQLGVIVYLRARWETLQARLALSTARPLVNSATGWDEVKTLWLSRLSLYEQADLTVDTDERTPAEIAAEILEQITDGADAD